MLVSVKALEVKEICVLEVIAKFVTALYRSHLNCKRFQSHHACNAWKEIAGAWRVTLALQSPEISLYVIVGADQFQWITDRSSSGAV